MARSPPAGQGEHAPLFGVSANARRERSRSPFGSAVKAGEPCPDLAWGGEPESLDMGNLWPRKERGNLRVPRGVRLRSPAHRVGRRPPPPGPGGGGVRPVAPTSKPESERTSHNAAPYHPPRIVQGDQGVGVRIHQRLSVIGRTVEHPPPAAASTAAETSAAKPGASSSPSASRSMCRASVAPQARAPTSSSRCQRSRPPRPAPGPAEWGPDAPVTVRREGQVVRGGHGDRRTWPAFS